MLAMVVCFTMSTGIARGQPKPANPMAVTLADFSKRVDDYAGLHKRLAGQVGELDETKSPAEIAAREKKLGDAIRAARADAKQGARSVGNFQETDSTGE
jgi:hypothetical protein